MNDRINICGVWINNVTRAEAIGRIERLIAERKPSYVVTPNVDHVVRFQTDADFRRIYDGASLVTADGMPLLWAGRFLGTPFKERVCGSDLLPDFCAAAAAKGYKIFFLGGAPAAADKAAEVLTKRHPGLRIVGSYCPPFGFEKDEEENRKIVERIKGTAPDILFVGLGSPKQEKWPLRFKEDLGVPVSIGVGVTFSFIAGDVKRAPRWMRDLGLEWLWRLMAEPGRLWKRYLVEDPVFFWLVWKQKLGRKK